MVNLARGGLGSHCDRDRIGHSSAPPVAFSEPHRVCYADLLYELSPNSLLVLRLPVVAK
jgi:hypothetical protein